jgi:PleD family two-component response regulator
MVLAKEGYEFVPCGTSSVALGIAGVSKFDLVITAHCPPEIDGLPILKATKERDASILCS